MFTSEELQALIILLSRVQIAGDEAEVVVALKQKARKYLSLQAPEETQPQAELDADPDA